MKLLDKKYSPSELEDRWYKHWLEKDYFSSQPSENHYTIVIPPPNVTGTLHMGHSFQYAIMDFYTRYHHMSGKDAHWQVGADHAGIATQALVEKYLKSKNINKEKIGRKKFIKKVWEWKKEYGGKIINQLKKLGCSCDWSRNAFTMDSNLSESVIKVFVELYKKKLIYKSKKLVNWDTVLKTAISDLEVDQREVNSKLYYIKYKI